MGKKILKLLLYLMAVVGVLIWLDSTEGLTEEGALIIFGIALLMYFVMKLIGFLTKRHRIRRERAWKARRKRELREVNNYRVKQETSVAATAASQANHRKQQKIHNQSGHKVHMTRKKIVWTVGLLATFCIVVLAGKTWIRQHEQIPESLLNMEEKYPEATNFVKNYPKRRHYQTIDISSEVETARENSEIPYFLQWDERWGYMPYSGGLLGYTGCGPTNLAMVVLYLTGDKTVTPASVAEYAESAGYSVPGSGSSWTLISEGCEHYGIHAEEVPMDEDRIKAKLDEGCLIIINVGPGDFTDSGHFITIIGYDRDGFIINDSNSRTNSKKRWSYEQLSRQMRNLWAMYN